MELSEILNSLTPGENTKTASDMSSNSGTSLEEAIDRALSSTEQYEVKEASVNSSPSDDLLKIAQDLSNAEQEALVKEATIYGRAVADGFAARLNEYGNTSMTTNSADPNLVKQAMELGYAHAMQAINHNDAMQKQASYYQNPQQTYYSEDQVKLAQNLQGQEDAVKVAYELQGQEDAKTAMHNLIKVAASYEDYGFKMGNTILKRLG